MKGFIILVGVLSMLGIGFYFVTPSGSTKTASLETKSDEVASTDSLLGVFEGKIPCDDCERIKVRLSLYVKENNSAGYTLERIYVGKGDDRTTNSGNWTISQGIKVNPNALVYILDSNSPTDFRYYYAVDDNLLLMLNGTMDLKVGDASGSYTLSRTR
jgi:hypothetical protein